MKKKYKKDVSVTDVKMIWKDYCEYAIIRPMLKMGKAKIDERTSIEIVGTRFENDPKLLAIMGNGKNINGIVKDAVRFDDNRYGIKYKIVFTDLNYKGELIFEADAKLKKRVHEELKNTQTYYRIKRDGNK